MGYHTEFKGSFKNRRETMFTIIDSWRISSEVADILAFYGVATDQTVVPVGEKTRYKVEIRNLADNDKAKALFPLRKWEYTMASF